MTDRYQNPTVASFVKNYRLEPAVLTAADMAEAFKRVLWETAVEVRTNGGLVGHIKAVVNFTPGGGLRLSVVKEEPRSGGEDFVAQAHPTKVEAVVTAIVFGPSAEELNSFLAQALKRHLPEALTEENHRN